MNLAPDKDKVFGGVFGVLKDRGKMYVSDVVVGNNSWFNRKKFKG